MTICVSRHFGEIDIASEERWFDAQLEVNGKPVETSITFLKPVDTLHIEEIQRIDQYLDELGAHEQKIRQSIWQDFRAGGESQNYIESQLEQQDADVIEELIAATNQEQGIAERLLSSLELLRIVFYPDKDDPMFAVFDYSIGEELTDELLAVKLAKNGQLGFDVES